MSDDPVKAKKEMFGDGNDSGSESPVAIWARRIGISILLLLAAILVIWFVFILPQSNLITELQAQLDAGKEQISVLETEVADLQAVLPEREIYSLLAQANKARFEVSRARFDSAGAALLPASRTISALSDELGDGFASTINDLESRLELAKAAIEEGDRIASLGDLEIFITILENLLSSLLTP
jgi:hypothetical protein